MLSAFYKNKSIALFCREVFSFPNLCAVFSVFVVFSLFLSCENLSDSAQKFGILRIGELTPQIVMGILIFWMAEFGIYYFLTWKKYKKDSLYVSVLIMLLFMPFVWVSSRYSRDFCMDATLPQLYVLMIYMIGYVKEELPNREPGSVKKRNIRNCLLIVSLGLAFTTPIFDWFNKINTMNRKQRISIQDQSVVTFSDMLGYQGDFGRPVSKNVDHAFFFRYLAKNIDKENSKWLPISDNLVNIRNISDIDQYFEYLVGKDCTVFIVVRDIQGYCLMPETVERMRQLGFDDHIDVLLQHEYHSFIGIVDNGRADVEQIGGDEYITYFGEGKIDGGDVWMESGTLNHGNRAVINIKNGYYSVNGRGFNIVVWDNAAERVIDSVCFDTHVAAMTCTRKEQ